MNGKYTFQEDNQLKDAENCLEEGKKKLEVGDLPSAVLLFEAAVQQYPESSEAWFQLGMSQVTLLLTEYFKAFYDLQNEKYASIFVTFLKHLTFCSFDFFPDLHK